MFVDQTIFNTLELRKTKALNMFLVGNQKGYIFLNLFHYILLSYITKRFGYKVGMQFKKCVLVVKQLSDQNRKSLHCL